MTVKITRLPTGLCVATDEMGEAESVVAGLWVRAGTRDELAKESGVAHLLEHMLFKGTRTRSSYALSSAIEDFGGMSNAHTTREETAYYARVLPDQTERALTILADMILNSRIERKELERERLVVIQEIGRDLDTPEDKIVNDFHEIAFLKQGLGRPILGTSSIIGKMSREPVRRYLARHYHTRNCFIVGAGRIDHDKFVELVKKSFSKMKLGKTYPRAKAHVTQGYRVTKRDTEQLHFMMGFPSVGLTSDDRDLHQLLGIILGGNASSRLFQEIREKRGLVYSIGASHLAYTDAGLLQIYAGTDPHRIKELIPILCQELRALSKKVRHGELERAKAQLKADYLMGQESVMRRAELLGHHLITYGHPISVSTLINRLKSISSDQVQQAAAKVFARKPIIAGLGPIEEFETYQTMLGQLRGSL